MHRRLALVLLIVMRPYPSKPFNDTVGATVTAMPAAGIKTFTPPASPSNVQASPTTDTPSPAAHAAAGYLTTGIHHLRLRSSSRYKETWCCS